MHTLEELKLELQRTREALERERESKAALKLELQRTREALDREREHWRIREAQPELEPKAERQKLTQEQSSITVDEFNNMYAEYFAVILKFFRKRGYSQEDALDLTQDTFLRAFHGLRWFRGESTIKTWVHKIATNVWRNDLRARSATKREAHQVPLHETPEAALTEGSVTRATEQHSPYDTLWEQQRRDLVQDALQALPPQMQRCMLLQVGGDLKYREIAMVLNISIDAVKSRIREARERLKSSLDQHITETRAPS